MCGHFFRITLATVIAEVESWWQSGQSCLTWLLNQLNLPSPSASTPIMPSVLDKVLPVEPLPDG